MKLKTWKMWQMAAAVAVAAAALAGCGGGGGAAATKATSTGTVSTTNGTTAAQFTVSAPAGVTILVPANTTLTDASGSAVTGTVNTSVSYSTTQSDLPTAAATLPAGTTLAAFADISMGAVKHFSQPVPLTLAVSGVNAGDTVELYSFDSAAWTYEGQQVVSSAGTITPSVRHLSIWGAFKTSTLHPAIPGAVQAVAGDGQVTVSWSAVTGAASYQVYYGTAAGVTTATGTKPAAATATSQTVTGLTNGTPYFFVVTATNAAGESLASSEVSATPLLAPVKPTTIAASGLDASVALAWVPVAGATSYNIYYGTSAGVTAAPASKLASSATASFTAATLTNGTPYFFVVTAVNSAGESPISSEKSATPSSTPQAPGSPSGVNVTIGTGQLTVDWATIVPNAASYNVCYLKSTTTQTTAGVISTGTKVNSTTSPVVLTVPSGTYWITVTAINAAGESGGQSSPKKVVLP